MKGKSRPKRTRLRAQSKSRQRPTLSQTQRRKLEDDMGYRFKDEDLLTHALTHPSLIDEFEGGARFSNQRLEFLGDRVLGLVMAEWLSLKYPKEREGYLTRILHNMVSGETCAIVGAQLNLRDYLFVDASMRNNETGNFDKAVGDAVEALIAAIYCDGGLDAAEKFIKRIWPTNRLPADPQQNQSAKTKLSDWCGANQKPYAVYEMIDRSGPDHAPVFTVKARIDGEAEAIAVGRNKQEAETAAADALLKDLTHE